MFQVFSRKVFDENNFFSVKHTVHKTFLYLKNQFSIKNIFIREFFSQPFIQYAVLLTVTEVQHLLTSVKVAPQ